jgi:hypothetical protein
MEARARRQGRARGEVSSNLLEIIPSLGLAVSSCESVDERHAGGGAFDDSYLGKRLDSNNPNLEDNQDEKGKTRVKSYSQWRHE